MDMVQLRQGSVLQSVGSSELSRFVPMQLINQPLDTACPGEGSVAPFGDPFWVMQAPLLKAISGEGFNCEPSAGNIPEAGRRGIWAEPQP